MKLTSLKLVDHLKERARKAAGAKLAAAVTVPDNLSWWYFQEFGTASRSELDSPHPEGYEIHPVNGKGLRLPATEEHPEELAVPYVGPPYTKLHPGVAPKSFVRSILPEIQQSARLQIMQALIESGLDPSAITDVLVDKIMPDVIEQIAASMERSGLAQRRADGEGKLGDQAPADAFRNEAEIIEKGSD